MRWRHRMNTSTASRSCCSWITTVRNHDAHCTRRPCGHKSRCLELSPSPIKGGSADCLIWPTQGSMFVSRERRRRSDFFSVTANQPAVARVEGMLTNDVEGDSDWTASWLRARRYEDGGRCGPAVDDEGLLRWILRRMRTCMTCRRQTWTVSRSSSVRSPQWSAASRLGGCGTALANSWTSFSRSTST